MWGWIEATKFSFNTLMLMDTWLLRQIARIEHPEFREKLAVALKGNPSVLWCMTTRCPEYKENLKKLVDSAPKDVSTEAIRDSEVWLLDALDWAVVYMFPELTEQLPYVRDWDPERLLSLTDFTAKTVLDIGSGTGRLALAAATLAKYVYATEPVDRFREYIRDKVKRLGINNVYVIDGSIEAIPFPDESFDIVMSGHTFGDDFEGEFREMMRVTRPGGYIIDCPGEDDREKDEDPKQEPLNLGFQYFHYTSKLGGEVYRYWKQKPL